MGIWTCIKITAPVIGAAVLPFLGFFGVGYYRYGLKNTWRLFHTYLSSAASWIHLLWEKGVFKVAAFFTTFSSTASTAYLVFRGQQGIGALKTVFVSEIGGKFLGAARYISKGLYNLTELVQAGGVCRVVASIPEYLFAALQNFWIGLSSIIMLLFIVELYARFRGKRLTYDMKLLLVAVLFMVTALVQGTEVVVAMLDNGLTLGDAVADAWFDINVSQGNVSQPDPGNLSNVSSGVESS